MRAPTSHRRLLRERLVRDEDGSVSLLAGVAMTALLGAAALAVDVGRIAWADREVQSTADLAALDAVRAVGDRRDPLRSSTVHATALAEDSLRRNAGFLELDGATPTLGVTVGWWDVDRRTFTPGVTPANAVEVVADTTLGQSVVPGTREVQGTAIAMVQHIGGLQVGSVLAAADIDEQRSATLNAVLGGMLGQPLAIDAVGYRGLADAGVRFGDLVTDLGLGSPEEAATATVGLAQLLDATATALSRSGDAADLAATTPLGDLRRSVAGQTVALGELFSIGPSHTAALEAEVDVLGLVVGAIQVATGTNAVTATVPVTLPGAATADATVAVVETPRIAIGPARQLPDGSYATVARTAQARLYLDLVVPGGVAIPTPLGPVSADLFLPVVVELGRGAGHLVGVGCPGGSAPRTVTILGETSTASASLGELDPATLGITGGALSVSPGTLVDVPGVVRVTGGATTALPGTSEVLTFTEPFGDTQRIGGTLPDIGPHLADGLTLDVEVLGAGLDVAGIRDTVQAQVADLLRQLDTAVLDDLAGALGVGVANADVTALLANCDERLLVR